MMKPSKIIEREAMTYSWYGESPVEAKLQATHEFLDKLFEDNPSLKMPKQ